MAGEITIFRRFPTGSCGIEFRWTRGDKAGVFRIRPLRARRRSRADRGIGKDQGGQANNNCQENDHARSLLPLCHIAILPTWLKPRFHF